MGFSDRINRIFWLLDIIVTHGPISLEDINKRWVRRSESLGQTIDRQIFMRDKLAIEEIFDIEIELVGRNRYKVLDPLHTRSRSLQDHMLANIHESNFLNSFRKLGSLISIPTVYKGTEYLSMIGEAMSENKVLKATYHKYDAEPYEAELEPYCLKLFNRRWYLFACKRGEERIKCFSLDRVTHMDITDIQYKRDSLFDPDTFFSNYFGVYVGGEEPDEVLIRTTKVSMKFLTDLPLHGSQRLITKNEGYRMLKSKGVECKDRDSHEYYFKFHIAPTPDFENELLRLCENCEVLYPIWFREKMKKRLEEGWKMYG